MDGTRTIPVIRSIQAQRQAAGNLTVTVSGSPWTVNQWAGYTIKKTSGSGGFAYIDSNTANTITFSARIQ